MELTTQLTRAPRKGTKKHEEEITLQKKEVVKGKWGMEAKTQYFPVKKQYKSFAELQLVIDKNFEPLKLGRIINIHDPNYSSLIRPLFYSREYIKSHHYDVNEFLQYFFTVYNHECGTFTNKSKSRMHCDQGRRRSLLDLYRICKYYYPLTSIKQVKEALWNLPFGINVFICPDIRRRVHRRELPAQYQCSITYNNADEFGWDYYCTNVEDSKYFKLTYKDLIPMINKTLKNCILQPTGHVGIDPNIEWYTSNNKKIKDEVKPGLQVTSSTPTIQILEANSNTIS